MIQYKKHMREGVLCGYSLNGNLSIPEASGNRHYDQMMQEVEAGLAEIVEVDDTPVPTVDELRIAAYGPIGDQLDEIYWDQVNGTTNWKDHVAAVKAANPK